MNIEVLKYKKIILGIVAAIIVVVLIVAAGSKSQSNAVKEGNYKTITDVDGVKFAIDRKSIDESTAVLEITDRIDFLYNLTYSYRNGEDMFLMFSIEQNIVVVKKGTNFNFAQNGIEESLAANSLNGIWFTVDGKTPKPPKEGEKFTVDVEGQVVITNGIYNDFYGKLTTITHEGTEWSMFVGADARYKEILAPTIEYVTESFVLFEREETNTSNYEVSLDDGSFAMVEEKEPITITPAEPEDTAYETKLDDNMPKETIPMVDNKETTPEETFPAPDEDTGLETVIPNNEETEVPVIEEPIDTAPPENENTEESSNKPLEEERFSVDNNQANITIDNSSAYTSSVYFMLNVGNMGYMDVYSEETCALEGAFIKPTRVLSAEETKKAIEDYCKSGKSYYTEMKAPDGCHFEGIEYDVKYSSGAGYTDIRLCGFDGEKLRHRGIAYSQRTYDILSDTIKDGWHCGNICFYIVPNGCKEYAIKCGDGDEQSGSYRAYFHIINN